MPTQALLEHGVLLQDLPSAELLTAANLHEPSLMQMARTVATTVGLPESTQFASHHPAKLFDYSTRARCLAPFCVTAVAGGGARGGQLMRMDLECHPFLRQEETKYLARARADAEGEVAMRRKEAADLTAAIARLSSIVETGKLLGLHRPDEERGAYTRSAEELGELLRVREVEVPAGCSDAELYSLACCHFHLPQTKKQKALDGKTKAAASRLENSSSGLSGGVFSLSDISAQAEAQRVERARLKQDVTAEAVRTGKVTAEEVEDMRSKKAYGTDISPEEQYQVAEVQLEACQRSLDELSEKTRVQQNAADTSRVKQAEWNERVAVARGGFECPLPIYPIGDSLLEPFWPQGLGSNRGFHSALDAVWATHVRSTYAIHEEGFAAALLERNFWYDLLLQGPWQPALLKPAGGWWADPISRYSDGAIVTHKSAYTDLQSKRLFRGAGAIPARIEAIKLKPTGGGFARGFSFH